MFYVAWKWRHDDAVNDESRKRQFTESVHQSKQTCHETPTIFEDFDFNLAKDFIVIKFRGSRKPNNRCRKLAQVHKLT